MPAMTRSKWSAFCAEARKKELENSGSEPFKIDFSKMKPRPISNLVLPKTVEQQLAEALASLKEKELEILELKSKLSKQDNVINSYFT
jgi:hypothetical protein